MLQKGEEEDVLLSLALKHDSPHWCQCWESTDQSENATKSAAIGGSCKAQGKARRQRMNPSCSPFCSQEWDGQPRGPSVTEIISAASPAVPLLTGMNLPLAIKFNMKNPEHCIQA